MYGPGHWKQSAGKYIEANGDSLDHNGFLDVAGHLDGTNAAPFVPLFNGGGQERGFRAG